MSENAKVVKHHLDTIVELAESVQREMEGSKGTSKAVRDNVSSRASYINQHVSHLRFKLAQDEGRVERRVDVGKSIERLTTEAAAQEAFVEKYTTGERKWGRLSSIIEVEVARMVAEELRSLADAFENMEGRELGGWDRPYKRVDERGHEQTYYEVAPEEHLAMSIEQWQAQVFNYVARMNSRSTSDSSRVEEQVRQMANAEMLQYVGAAPVRSAYSKNLVCWTETVKEEV